METYPNIYRNLQLMTILVQNGGPQILLNPFIQIDLGVSKSICKVSIAWADGSSHQYSFNISVYTEGTGTTCLPVFSGATIGNTTSAETYTFPPTQGRYVKMIITRSTPGSTSSVAQISEIDAFGP